MPYKDIERQRQAQREYAARNRKRYNEVSRTRRSERRKIVEAAKSVPCMDCDIEWPPYVMDFDHVRGEKKFNISMQLSTFTTIEELLEEIAKCDVVCSNCHRVRTWGRLVKDPGSVSRDSA